MKSRIALFFALLTYFFIALPAYAGSRGELVQVLLNGIRDTSGNPCSSCKVYTYTAGTSNAKDTFTDNGKATAGANPIVLDSNGQAQRYADGSYKFIVTTSADVTLYTWDNLNFGFDRVDSLTGLSTGGTGAAYTLSLSPAPAAYVTGMFVYAKAAATASASATLNVNGLGAKSLVEQDGTALEAGDIVSGQVFAAVYDGTNFLVLDGRSANGTELYCGTSSGTNTITATCPANVSGATPPTGAVYRFLAGGTNTGAATLNLNGQGAYNIFFDNGSNALNGGEIQTGYFYDVVFDGTRYRLVTQPTGWSSYTPTLTTSGSLTLSSTSIVTARYRKRGLGIEVQIAFTGTLGGTASDTVSFTLPFTAASNGTRRVPAYVVNSGTVEVGFIEITNGATTGGCKRGAAGNYGTSGAFECNSNFYYEHA
jgi:hypothetical protein